MPVGGRGAFPLALASGLRQLWRMKNIAFALVAPLALAACMTTETEAPTVHVADNACNLQSYIHLVGQPASVLDGMTLPENKRILRPNQPMTMDMRADRINFIIDAGEKIESIYCA